MILLLEEENQRGRLLRLNHWAQILGFFLIHWIRLTGYALLVWVMVCKWRALTLLVMLAVWLAVNYRMAGDPFYFHKVQAKFLMPGGALLEGLSHCVRELVLGPGAMGPGRFWDWVSLSFLPFVYFILLGLMGIVLLVRRESLAGLALFGIVLLSHNIGYWRSSVRYDGPLMPLIFIPLLSGASQSKYRWIYQGLTLLLLVGQFYLQFVFAREFRLGHWAF